MKKLISFFGTLFFLLAGVKTPAQAIPVELTGAGLHPHETINKTEFTKQYEINKAYWDEAFSFLKNSDLKRLPAGRYAIDSNNVFAFITENATKSPDSAKWESHRLYVDLHLVIDGEEKIGVADTSTLAVTMPYDPSKDLANYIGEGKFYRAEPGTFFLFFPADAHRPNVTTGGNKPDKKIVIKIRYASN